MVVGPLNAAKLRAIALGGVALAAIVAASGVTAALAQDPSPASGSDLLGLVRTPDDDARMLVEADSLVYDINAQSVSAIGKVVIYYGVYTLTADRVEVNRTTKRVRATGSVEITDGSGNTVRGDDVDLTDDLRDGIAQGFELVTAERVAFRARSAARSNGDVTEFNEGVYQPCIDCNGRKGREPIWQIRANRIIHRQGERTVTFEDARFEFLGVPIAWVPTLTQPDPSVRRKSGVLIPRPSYSEELGVGLTVPYFWALAPNMDVTFTPGYFSRQGPYADVEFRHRTIDGAYSVRLAGLHQEDPAAYSGLSADRDWRGAVASQGDFAINERWSWGWDIAVASDRSFFDDFNLPQQGGDAYTNQVYLSGVDGRNRFDARGYGFFVEQEDDRESALPQDRDLQTKQPIVHPVVDYQVFAPESVAGGELSLTANVTSLTRQRTDIYRFKDGRERLQGAAGTNSRGSIEALWRRRFVDAVGQVFTPFTYVRGDVFFSAPKGDPGLADAGDSSQFRGMAAVGLEYSYPIQVVSAVGNQVFEPVAQLIARPNETETGDIANEDSQSLVFDANSLFSYDKFSGYDRVEGGTRLNLGMRYTGQFVNGMALAGTVGRSLHLAGSNSFAIDTPYDTGEESGLETSASDWVGALSFDSGRGLLSNLSARFDETTFDANRIEAQLIGISGALTAAFTYAFIREQPDYGVDEDRQELQAAGSLRLDENWRAFGSMRFDIENEELVRHTFGFAYDAEEFSLSLGFAEDRTTVDAEPDRTVYVRLGFRTLGDVNASLDAGN